MPDLAAGRVKSRPAEHSLVSLATDVRRELGDDFGEGMTLHNLGEVKDSLDDLPAAAELFGQSLAVHRAAGHLRGEARALHRLG